MVRRVMLILIVAGVVGLTITGLASGAGKKRCGTRYTPACTKPGLKVKPLPPGCNKAGTSLDIPISASSNAGIRKLVATLGSKTIKTITFKGNGPTSYKIASLPVSTTGLAPGMYTLKVTVTDVRGKTVVKSVRFTICKPAVAPVFTG